MPITGLKDYLNAHNLLHVESTNNLRGTRLVIEGAYWFKSLQEKLKEEWHHFMGGLPVSTTRVLDEEIKLFQTHEITPIFVFNGISVQHPGPDGRIQWPRTQGFEHYKKREEAWASYSKREQIDEIKMKLNNCGSVVTSKEFLTSVINHFRKRKVEFFRAPYLSYAQAAWFVGEKDQYANAVLGSEEMLLFAGLVHCDRVILSLTLEKDRGQFEWASITEICESMGQFTASQFIDTCIFAGFHSSHLRNFPYDEEQQAFRGYLKDFSKIASEMRNFTTKQQTCSGLALLEDVCIKVQSKKKQQLRDHYLRTKNLIHHHIVLTTTLDPIPISFHSSGCHSNNIYKNMPVNRKMSGAPVNRHVPYDLSSIFGPRLPPFTYFFIATGLLSPQVVENVIHNCMMEFIPNIDTKEYRELLQKIVPLRTQIAYLLVGCFSTKDPEWMKYGRRMQSVQWCMEEAAFLNNPAPPHLDDWDVEQSQIYQHCRKNERGEPELDFGSVLYFHARALKPLQPHMQGQRKVYRGPHEVMCGVLLKTMDLLGYFTHPPLQRPYGDESSGMSVFAESLRGHVKTPEHSEKCLLLIELLRTGVLNSSKFTAMNPTNVVDPPRVTEESDPRIVLISRIFSILPCELDGRAWSSIYVSRDLCAFNVLVKSLSRTLRNLTEIVMCILFLEGKVATRDSTDMVYLVEEVGDKLPFGEPLHTTLGIVIEHILQCFVLRAKEPWEAHKIEEKFPNCIDIKGDIRKAMRFWKEAFPCMVAVVQLLTPQQTTVYVQADKLLQEMCLNFCI